MNTLRLIFVSTLNTYSLISTPEAEKIISAGYPFFITKYTAFSIAISRENPQIFRLRRGNPLSLTGKNYLHFSAGGSGLKGKVPFGLNRTKGKVPLFFLERFLQN